MRTYALSLITLFIPNFHVTFIFTYVYGLQPARLPREEYGQGGFCQIATSLRLVEPALNATYFLTFSKPFKSTWEPKSLVTTV